MKLIKVRENMWVLDEIKENRKNWLDGDVRVKNLSGAPSKEHPEWAREYVILVFVDDPDIRSVLLDELHLVCKEIKYDIKDENGNITSQRVKYSFKFKAYPRVVTDKNTNLVIIDPRTGKPEVSPVVMLKERKMDGAFRNEQLELDKIGRIDITALSNMAIKFHTFDNSHAPGTSIAAIDEVWAIADQSAGIMDEDYLRNKYDIDDESEETPFN